MKTNNRVHFCPVETCMELLNGKWKPRILWHLHQNEVLRFNELRRKLPGVTAKMLTQQLRELERDGLVTRTVYPVVPPKVEYRFSELGESFRPILDHIANWGVAHNTQIVTILEAQTA
ncbi:MAG: helix-turn-helix domain-containing protein [Chloroflexota bacterium]